MAQWISLPLTVSCFSKIQIGFTFLVPAHPGSPGQRAVKRVCVTVILRVVWCWYYRILTKLRGWKRSWIQGVSLFLLSCCTIWQFFLPSTNRTLQRLWSSSSSCAYCIVYQTEHCWCCRRSTRRTVYLTVGCLSVYPVDHQQQWHVAGLLLSMGAGSRYRPIADMWHTWCRQGIDRQTPSRYTDSALHTVQAASITCCPHGVYSTVWGDIPALIPAEAGTRLGDPGGMQGWVDLVGLLHTEMVYPPEDGHPSRY